jgi:hypothetical protein
MLRLRVAAVRAVANCETADRFVNSASPHAAAPRSLTDLHQKPCKPGHVHRARSPRAGRRRDCDGQTADPTSLGGPPAVALRRPTATFVRGAAARAELETFVYSLKALLIA